MKEKTLEHIREVQSLLGWCIRELSKRQDQHDASKLETPEAEIFEEWTPKLSGSTYGSPEYADMLAAMKPALDHHYANNSHHPEYYSNGILGMDLLDLLEMICDWMAAAKRHADGNVFRSIQINQKRFEYSGELAAILGNTVSNFVASKLRVGDRVTIHTCEGFGGHGVIIDSRRSPTSHFKIRLDDGSQPDFWAHDFEIVEVAE